MSFVTNNRIQSIPEKPHSEGILSAELSTSAFESLEREFIDFIRDVETEPSLARFRVEHEKIFRALRKSYNQEKRLLRKCKVLNAEIVNNAAKVESALNLSQQDQNNISSLKEERNKALSLLEIANEKESRAKSTIETLQKEVDNLSSQLFRIKTKIDVDDATLKEIMQSRDEATLELKISSEKLTNVNNELRDTYLVKETLCKDVATLKNLNLVLTDDVQKKDSKLNHVNEIRFQLEQTIVDLQSKLDEKTEDYLNMQCASDTSKVRLEQILKQKLEMEKIIQQLKSNEVELNNRIDRINETTENQKVKIAGLSSELRDERKELNLLKAELTRSSCERVRMQKKNDDEHRTVLRLHQKIEERNVITQSLQSEIDSLCKEIDSLKDREKKSQRNMVILEREKNVQQGKILKTEQSVKKVNEDVLHKDQVILSWEKECMLAKDESESMKMIIHNIQKVCDKQSVDANKQKDAFQKVTTKLRACEMEMQELRKKQEESDKDKKDQEKMRNHMQGEYGKVSRQLSEAETKIRTLTNEINIKISEVQNLKNELSDKNENIVKGHYDWRKVEAQKVQLINEVSRLKQQNSQQDVILQKQGSEILNFENMLRQTDEVNLSQRKDYDRIINERDILGTQVIRRNDELALLYEKVKILESSLRKGELQYRERLDDMRLMRLKIKEIQRDFSRQKAAPANLERISKDLQSKERELFREKAKVKALSEELENPLNVHRWRTLEASDPSIFEMVNKIQTLQKRLIKRTEQVI